MNMQNRQLPRWSFAAIPLGFAAMVGLMVLAGQPTGGPVSDPDMRTQTDPLDASASPVSPELVVDNDGKQAPFVPTPSGPEGRDNAVFFE